MNPTAAPSFSDPATGGRLVGADARTLPLVRASLAVDAGGGLARTVLEQRFRNPHAEPLAVTYSLPLPADAAVSGFAFRIGERRIVGEVDRRGAARERYERALVDGQTAALLEQERSSLFTQQLGNVPPGQEVVAEITIDQRLAWLDEGAWEWRFPTTVAPRYLGASGRVPDAARIAQDVADAPMPVRLSFDVRVRDGLDGRAPESPSHALRAEGDRARPADPEGVPLDRDVVVRWRAAKAAVGVRVETALGPKQEMVALLTVVPPARAATGERVARDLVLLLDVSGSMAGEPLMQARRVASALVATLDERDSLEMIAFASAPTRWQKGSVRATPEARRDAARWLGALVAQGGTEMRHAIEEALAPRRDDGQRQVVLVTDGQIGFESEIVATILARLPKQSRVHVVGVGSAPNRTLTAHAPRAGRGIEVLVGLGEAAERAAARIVARTDAPIVVELELSGDALVDHAPRRLPDLFAGAPALIGMRARAGELVVRGRTASGPWEQRVRLVTPAEKGRVAVGSFYARERVEDLETDLAAGGEPRAVERGIEQLGLDFGLATRMTSWVAVSEHRTVDPGAPLRRERMPHELPFGASVEGLGLRACAVMPASAGQATMAARAPQAFAPMPAGMASPPPPPRSMAPRVMRPPAEAMRRVGGFLGGRGGAAGRRLQGRVVLRDAGVLVVEIGAQEAMTWALPVEAEITWDDGTTTRVGVVAERSTHAGAVPPGAGVRLALDVADARAMASVAFDAGGERWIVVC